MLAFLWKLFKESRIVWVMLFYYRTLQYSDVTFNYGLYNPKRPTQKNVYEICWKSIRRTGTFIEYNMLRNYSANPHKSTRCRTGFEKFSQTRIKSYRRIKNSGNHLGWSFLWKQLTVKLLAQKPLFWIFDCVLHFSNRSLTFKRQPHKMVKHTQQFVGNLRLSIVKSIRSIIIEME